MQRFFILRLASDPYVIGVDASESQSEIKRTKFINTSNYDSLMRILGSHEYWKYKGKLSQHIISVERVELSSNAILTDFIQFSPALINCPFLLSARVKNIIDDKNAHNFKFYKTSVFDGPKKYEYCLIHLDRMSDAMIDFEKSVFFTGNDLLGDKQFVEFHSVEEKESYARENVDLCAEVLSIKSNGQINPDIFSLGSGEVIISEAIKTKLEKIGTSGINTLPAFGPNLKWPEIRLEN